MKAKSCDLCGSDDERYSDTSSLAAHSVVSLRTSAQRSGHRGPPPRHPGFVSRTSLVARAVSPLTRPPAGRTIGFQPVAPRAHRPVESQSLDPPPQTTSHQVSAHRAVCRKCPFDNPKNWPHQSTAAGPLLLFDSPLSPALPSRPPGRPPPICPPPLRNIPSTPSPTHVHSHPALPSKARLP